MIVKTKRAYDPPSPDDGRRVLVDRVWPRGVSRDRLEIDAWLRDLAPSTELRQWFSHESTRWAEFSKRFKQELQSPDQEARLDELLASPPKGTLTLVYGARDREHNQAVVLREILQERAARASAGQAPA